MHIIVTHSKVIHMGNERDVEYCIHMYSETFIIFFDVACFVMKAFMVVNKNIKKE